MKQAPQERPPSAIYTKTSLWSQLRATSWAVPTSGNRGRLRSSRGGRAGHLDLCLRGVQLTGWRLWQPLSDQVVARVVAVYVEVFFQIWTHCNIARVATWPESKRGELWSRKILRSSRLNLNPILVLRLISAKEILSKLPAGFLSDGSGKNKMLMMAKTVSIDAERKKGAAMPEERVAQEPTPVNNLTKTQSAMNRWMCDVLCNWQFRKGRLRLKTEELQSRRTFRFWALWRAPERIVCFFKNL